MEPRTDFDNSGKPEDSLSIPDMITFDKEEQDITLEVPEHILSTINSAKLAKLSEDYKMSMDNPNHSSLDQHVVDDEQTKSNPKNPSSDMRASTSSTSSASSKLSVTSLNKTKLSPSRSPSQQDLGQQGISSAPIYCEQGQTSDREAVPEGYHQGAPMDKEYNDSRLNEKSPSTDTYEEGGGSHSQEESQKNTSMWSSWFSCCIPSRN
ncbi:hypothetical protein IWQ62_006106 [Dispira parvispora]|uniref:Uncharacterized protein n=1 Tax=Dispira parvispora TaxID=1520584 RepID=A0A9W8E432_9FUNG|nr:hypothetical protein IWQ62_006106 [Dispira parvispora]